MLVFFQEPCCEGKRVAAIQYNFRVAKLRRYFRNILNAVISNNKPVWVKTGRQDKTLIGGVNDCHFIPSDQFRAGNCPDKRFLCSALHCINTGIESVWAN